MKPTSWEPPAERITGRLGSLGGDHRHLRLEDLCRCGPVTAGQGHTDIFIYPPYEFQVVDALLTNFHLPKSTLSCWSAPSQTATW